MQWCLNTYSDNSISFANIIRTIDGDRDINHAWNAVKLDRAWYLVDTTWGAGTLSGMRFQPKFNPYYFAAAPQQLIYSHYPAKEKWQLLAQPYSRQDFELLPKVFSYFFKNQLQFVSHKTKTVQADGRVDIVLNVPEDTLISAQLLAGTQQLDDRYTFVQRQGNNTVVSAATPRSGNYELLIFAKNKRDSGNYYQAITYQLQAVGTGANFPKTYGTFIESGAYLSTPKVNSLPQNSTVLFQLTVPNAEEVVIIDDRGQWTKLSRQGNNFSGNATIGSGKVRLAAKFPNSSEYAVLLEYQ